MTTIQVPREVLERARDMVRVCLVLDDAAVGRAHLAELDALLSAGGAAEPVKAKGELADDEIDAAWDEWFGRRGFQATSVEARREFARAILKRAGGAPEPASASELRLTQALQSIIKWNRDHAADQYGDAEKAESWACIVEARAAINGLKSTDPESALQAVLGGAPGYVLVPIEPTPEMLQAVLDSGLYHDGDERAKAVLTDEYRAMLAARPNGGAKE